MAKFEGSSPPPQGRIKAEDFIKWTKLKVRGVQGHFCRILMMIHYIWG